ncbi:heme-copper oxidase subunit III [Haloplanus rallus]|jgi:cytochrome c oxidase subunit 3|uniref:Heme-copper oxidase subunit III n=1 Tax=Haloplanus rallus TaxID=1816183 RepID=A0A6B9F8U3_9EURY|nr:MULTISPECIES: heme-copper oxidase subunit III [Haloplanus]QGX94897.1 heme-copper oxidase subunit III [Haloplanus rallus]
MSTDHGGDDHGHHLPAVEDWPRGFGEASWWPFITALGAGGIYLGAALFIVSGGSESTIDPMLAPLATSASVGAFLFGLYGWIYHAFVTEFWSSGADETSASALRWGMIAFLGSEIATFGGVFTYYFFIRAGTWPPGELPHLTGSLVIINTAILVASSLTLHWAHVAIRNDDRRKFALGLLSTLILGLVFIGGQVYEYYEFIVHTEFTVTSGLFGSAFYGLTGLHGLHVSLGGVLLAIVTIRALAGQYSAERHVSVSTVSMYWHFVDVVWIFLVVILYLGGSVGA